MEENKQDEKEQRKQELRSWFLWVAVPVFIVLFLNAFVGKLVWVDGDSMYPTLHDRDLLIVSQLPHTPVTGDIAVITTSADSYLGGENIVKRVIASGGQQVVINYGSNTVSVDGVTLEEPYINTAEEDPMLPTGASTYDVPEGYVFVMGDNRNHSLDSRSESIGMVPVDIILGNMVADLPIGRLLAALSPNK